MKRVVFLEDIAESEIRPDSLYNEYRNILKEEIPVFFSDQSQFVKVDCPGCSAESDEQLFVKFGFQYCKCNSCGSVFASPRPTAEMLADFFKNSRAVKFWRSEVEQKTKEKRHRHQSFPMGHWVLESIDEYLSAPKTFLDYNSKHPDFLKIVDEGENFDRTISINPEFSNLLPDGIVVHDSLDSLDDKVDVITAFEVLERIFDPAGFIRDVSEVCQKGGLFFLTTNTISGFEYQMLYDKSPRLHPPDRINLLSIEAIQNRLTQSGFEVIELSTPGRVDVEIVRDVLQKNPDVAVPGVFKYIFENRDAKTWHSLQDFLQQNRLSSYVRIMAKKI